MSAEAAKLLAKPQMRGMLQSQIKKNIIGAFIVSVLGGIIYKFTVCEPRKQRYAEYYKNYDPYKAFEEMKALGVFQSCPPGS